MKYSWKGHKDRNRHKDRIKRSGQARLVITQTVTSPPRDGEPAGTCSKEEGVIRYNNPGFPCY